MAQHRYCAHDELIDNSNNDDAMEYDFDHNYDSETSIASLSDVSSIGDYQPPPPRRTTPVSRKPNDVCFKAWTHPGTEKWRQAIQKYSNNRIEFPVWSENIFHQIEEDLARDRITRFLVSLDSEGQPCKYINEGQWFLATQLEIIKRTRERFQEDRKARTRRKSNEERKPRGRPPNRSGSITSSTESPVSSQSSQTIDLLANVRAALTYVYDERLNLAQELRVNPPSNALDYVRDMKSKLVALHHIVSRFDDSVVDTALPPRLAFPYFNPFDDSPPRGVSGCDVNFAAHTMVAKPDSIESIEESPPRVAANDDSSHQTETEEDAPSICFTTPVPVLSAVPSEPVLLSEQDLTAPTSAASAEVNEAFPHSPSNAIDGMTQQSPDDQAPSITAGSESPTEAKADSPETMLVVLLAEMQSAKCSSELIVSTLGVEGWADFYASLNANDFGIIIANVPEDYDRPRVAELLAQQVNGFTCEHVARAIPTTTFHVCMARHLYPFCADAATQFSTITVELGDQEVNLLTTLLSEQLRVE